MPLSKVLALLTALACAACAPMPHLATTLPAISGSLTDAGAPVAGRQVWIARGPDAAPCAKPWVTATTAADGKFHLARQTEFRLIYAPHFTPWSLISLCAATANQPMLLFRGGFSPYGALSARHAGSAMTVASA
jgi:hypothetical protein